MTPYHPSIDLKLIRNARGRSKESREYQLIDCTPFPDKPGVYVIRYSTYKVARMVGASSILKIGKADVSIQERFANYNHMRHVTKETKNLIDLLDELPQPTNVRLMHFISHERQPSPIVVDCYFPKTGQSPRELEKHLLREYFTTHHELPPLNFGLR